ncbi:hypothetical protein [Acidocella sp.]|jgi:long-subunit fatty acid transport protein|uniref:hypothetical protein n=1 Tax=Acidocella sp. TaxID=50710 RepID=UPI002F405352
MNFSMKILPAMALAIALSPFAAQAQSAHQPAATQTHDHVDAVMVSSATIDNPTHVYSNNLFPDSFGG